MQGVGGERTAVVTGSARRVGLVIATTLIADGWRVLIHATDAARAAETCDALDAAGFVGADLAEPDAADAIAEACRTAFGASAGLGILVNSAASFERVERWESASVDSWNRAMNVNARAPYLLTCALLPMLRRARGLVVNISDRAAHEHWPVYPVHSASKAAMESLTRSGAAALRRDGVRMCAIAPGTIMPPSDWTPERIEQEAARGALGTPDELVRAVLDLASDPERTGEIIRL